MPFAAEEYRQRYANLQAALDEIGAEALLVTSEANFNYFTGYIAAHPWVSFSRNLIAILPREAPPLLIVPASLEGQAREQTWIEEIRTFTTIGFAPVTEIAAAFRDRGLANAHIGAEMGYEQRLGISPLDYQRLQDALPEAAFVDAAPAIWPLRMRKSPAEVAALREAARITDVALAQFFREVSPQMTERDMARRLGVLLLEGGADRIDWIMMTSGTGDYHRTFGVPRNRRLEPGDMVWLDVSAVIDGYRADYDRTAVLGGPTAEQERLQALVHEATQAGIAAIQPGAPVAGVVDAVNASLQAAGFAPRDSGRIGHGLGLQSTEPPDVSLTDPTILAPGMVITVEPALIYDHGIYQTEQNIAVTETGHEVLTHAPWQIQEFS
jgi:Xaa-Pro aminopeptidase